MFLIITSTGIDTKIPNVKCIINTFRNKSAACDTLMFDSTARRERKDSFPLVWVG